MSVGEGTCHVWATRDRGRDRFATARLRVAFPSNWGLDQSLSAPGASASVSNREERCSSDTCRGYVRSHVKYAGCLSGVIANAEKRLKFSPGRMIPDGSGTFDCWEEICGCFRMLTVSIA